MENEVVFPLFSSFFSSIIKSTNCKMASRLDQALDEVIQDRRSERQGSGGGRRYNRGNSNRGGGGRGDFTRRRQVDSDGTIRKRLGPSDTIRSFVRTVNVKNEVVRK